MTNPLVQPDPGLFVWTILTFLVLVGLLAKFAWRPLLDALERREQSIAAAVDDARKTREELERVQQEGAALLAQARRDADALVSRARVDAERFGEELRKKASADSQRIVENAEKRIEQETQRAMQQIRRDAVELSVAIASKLLRREVSLADQDALIDETVKQIQAREH